jgi:hypothetical protein
MQKTLGASRLNVQHKTARSGFAAARWEEYHEEAGARKPDGVRKTANLRSETSRHLQQLLIHRFAFLRRHIVPEPGNGRRISVCDVARLRWSAITEIQQHIDRRHAQPVAFAAVYHPNQSGNRDRSVLPNQGAQRGLFDFAALSNRSFVHRSTFPSRRSRDRRCVLSKPSLRSKL